MDRTAGTGSFILSGTMTALTGTGSLSASGIISAMAALVSARILQQSGAAILASADQQPSLAIELLKP